MINQIGTVLDKLEGYFGKRFLLTGFLPVATFALATIPLLAYLFPAVGEVFMALWLLPALDQGPILLGCLMILSLAGFLLSISTSYLRLLLDGRKLPSLIRQRLQKIQLGELGKLETKLDEGRSEVGQFRKAAKGKSTWVDTLALARQNGEGKGVPGSFSVPESLLQARDEISSLKDLAKPVPFAKMNFLYEELKTALENAPGSKITQLAALHTDFLDLSQYASDRAEASYGVLRTERYLRFPGDTAQIGPTQLANLDEVTREYAHLRYGMDVEFLWPRLQQAIQEDEKASATMDQAKRQLDFAVAMTWVSGTYALMSYVLTIWKSPDWLAYWLVPTSAMLATFFFYRGTVQATHIYNETLRSMIDLYRFKLLELLHIKKPAKPVEERPIWATLCGLGAPGDAEKVEFEHKQ